MPTIEDIDARIAFERTTKSPMDLEFEPIRSEDEDYESAPPDYQISTYPADFTLEVLYQKWKAAEITIPFFQRGFVWKQVQASKLIESFLVGLPVPSVFMYSERKSQKFLVIDGQQRLRSIFYFFEGYFGPSDTQGKRQEFRLTGLSPKSYIYNKTFEDLKDEDKLRFKNAVLRAFIVQQLDPDDETSMYHIFERLNTGGTLLANQEIRNCIYHGRFIDLLNEINKLPSWRKILGKDNIDTRGKDIELIVRFFAMRDISAYKKPMKDWLSRFMKKHRDAPQEVLDSNRNLFLRTCEQVLATLGERPFHVLAGLNVAVFDAVMTVFSKHLDSIPSDIERRYNALKEDADFKKNTSTGTTDVDTVKGRQEKAESVLFG